jgi:hypothetical protein
MTTAASDREPSLPNSNCGSPVRPTQQEPSILIAPALMPSAPSTASHE